VGGVITPHRGGVHLYITVQRFDVNPCGVRTYDESAGDFLT